MFECLYNLYRLGFKTDKLLTHSSCKTFKMAGILVAEAGLGFTRGLAKNNKIHL